MKFGLTNTAASIVIALAGVSVSSAAIISDDFQTNSALNYNVINDGTPDGTVNFQFDYVAAGLPLAPRSAAGGGTGLRFTANDIAPAAVDAYSAFHITTITVPQYRVTVDVYMGFLGATGSTEFALIGVGGNGTTTNRLGTGTTPATGQSGSGSFFGFSGDGGAARDYLWYLDALNGGVGTVSASTVLPNSISPTYLAGGAGSELPLYNSIFPGTTPVNGGFPGNRWTTVDILVDETIGQIEYSIGGTAIIRGSFTGSLNGRVSLGYADFFTSVAVPAGNVFGIYDNLTVTAVPEPTSLMLLGIAAVGGISVKLRRRKTVC